MNAVLYFLWFRYAARRWLFVWVPVVLGVASILIGWSLVRGTPNRFGTYPPAHLEVEIIADCRELTEAVADAIQITLARTSEYDVSLVVDSYGILKDALIAFAGDDRGRYIDPILEGESSFAGLDIFPGFDRWRPDVPAHCDNLYLKVGLDDLASTVEHVADVILETEPSQIAGFRLTDPDDPQNSSIEPASVDIEQAKLSATAPDSYSRWTRNDQGVLEITTPIDSRVIATKVNLHCPGCIRGYDGLALSLTTALYHLKAEMWGTSTTHIADVQVSAKSSARYIVQPWGYGNNILKVPRPLFRRGYDLEAGAANWVEPVSVVWNDLDSDRRADFSYMLSGVLIGLGISMLTSALVAVLHVLYWEP